MLIDGVAIKMPNGVREYYDYIRTDNKTLNGRLQRNQINKKRNADLTWTNIFPAELNAILAWADDLNAHTYSNSLSKYGTFNMIGLVTILNDGEYMKGQSVMTDSFTVNIREV